MKSIITAMLAAASFVTVASAADVDSTTVNHSQTSSNGVVTWSSVEGNTLASTLSSWAITFTIDTVQNPSTGDTSIISTGVNSSGNGAAGLAVRYDYDNGYLQLGYTNQTWEAAGSLTLSEDATYTFAYDAVTGTVYLGNTTTEQYISYTLTDSDDSVSPLSITSGAVRQWTNSARVQTTVGTVYDISSLSGDTDAVVTLVTTGSVVPEPATATLSLLALAGLAARRRRK